MKEYIIASAKKYRVDGDIYLACCDCGLVHTMKFEVEMKKGKPTAIIFRMWRNEKMTKRQRSKSNKKLCITKNT